MIPKPVSLSKHHHLLIACMPKSGSTYLRMLLAGLPDMRSASLVPGHGRREQELDVGRLRATYSLNYVAQHHIRYSSPLGELLDQFDVKPIVLVRNIFDIVISVRDHFRNESVEGSMAYIHPDMILWEDRKLEHFIVTMCIPWYFNFYMSWTDCSAKCLVRYEDLVHSPASVVGVICKEFSVESSPEMIDRTVDAANMLNTRKNQGIIGRSKDLEDTTKEQILEMASFYEDVDFTPIGLFD